MNLVYISGKYTDAKPANVKKNVVIAKNAAVSLWKTGMFSVICPHKNTESMEKHASYDCFLKGDLEQIKHCDFMLVLPNWKSSKGTKVEMAFAKKNGIPLFFSEKALLQGVSDLCYGIGKNVKCSLCNKVRKIGPGLKKDNFVCKQCSDVVIQVMAKHLSEKFTVVPKLKD